MPDGYADTIIDIYSRAVRYADARGHGPCYADAYGVAHVRRYLDTHGIANDDAATDGYDDGYRDAYLNAGRDLDPYGHRVLHTDRLTDEHADGEPEPDA